MKGLDEKKDFYDKKIKKTKIHVYGTKENPLIVDLAGKSKDFFPTLYAVMLYPTLLKTNRLVLNAGVEKFLYKGANLMWPGVD